MSRRGVTLVEMMAVLTIIGILAGLAAPRLSGMLSRERTRSALNRFTVDFHLARMAALRSGQRVELRFTSSGSCPAASHVVGADGWSIVMAREGRVLKQVRAGDLDGVCLQSSNDAILVVDSRGLLAPFENRTVRALGAGYADSLTVNVLGRVTRKY
jgi:prepilin-type N-terminal cleavage/methylation domain-containing protein